jgi:thioredoxin reductase (NADPH)
VYDGAAHTEAANYQDRDVVVIGAANSAAQGLLFIARYACKVTVLIRGSDTTWSRYLDVDIRSNPKIELRFNSELAEIWGDGEIRDVDVRHNRSSEIVSLPASAVFVFIGQRPHRDFVANLVKRTDSGHILTGLDLI